jgi:hypothetical protein
MTYYDLPRNQRFFSLQTGGPWRYIAADMIGFRLEAVVEGLERLFDVFAKAGWLI